MATVSTSQTPATSSNIQKPLDPLVFQRLNPRAYFERFLAENVRPDGREFDECRNVNVNVGRFPYLEKPRKYAKQYYPGSITTAEGSSLVRMGNTTVVCGVKAEIAEPDLDKPELGFLVPNIDLPPLCSARFKSGPPGEEAQILSERLNEVLISSAVVPLSSLCIQPGKAVWALYIDAICLNYDGNIFDAALMAIMAALKNTYLPKATYDEDMGRTTCTRKEKLPLRLESAPLSASFGIFDNSHLLADPTSFEEPLLDATITVILDDDSTLHSLLQIGLARVGEKSGEEVIAACVAVAKKRCAIVRSFMNG